jgi:PAS domain S-box-containing protein
MINKATTLSVLRQYALFLLQHKVEDFVSPDNKPATPPTLLTLTGWSSRDILEMLSAEPPQALTARARQKLLEPKDSTSKADPSVAFQLVTELNRLKKLFLGFLPVYTPDVAVAINIVHETDAFFFELQAQCFRVVLEDQQKRDNELQSAMKIAQIGSYQWDIQQDIITFTPQLYQIFGLEKEAEISYSTIGNLVHPDDKERFNQSVQESLEEQWPLDLEYRILRNGKEERVVWGKGQVSYENGKPAYMQGTILDVTEKRLTEFEVQYREAQLVEAQSIASIGSFDWDFINNTSSCTTELYRIFGWPKERALNFKTFEELSHPNDLEKVFQSLHNAMTNQGPYDCEYRIIRPDNSQKWVWARGKVTFDKAGNGIRLTGTVLDITERKQAEEEINKKNQAIVAAYQKLEGAQAELKTINQGLENRVKERTLDLEQSILEQQKSAEELRLKNNELEKINADLDNFIYTASHDLRAPIANIEGLIIVLAGMVDQQDPKFNKIFDLMETSISRFKTTIKDLTEISKVQKDIRQDVASIPLSEIVEDVLFDIEELIRSSGAKISTRFDVLEIKFSRKNLRSIFYNLISNAIKYSDSMRLPIVEISSSQEGNAIVVQVTDNGLGIPEGKTEKIFSMFKRLHSHVEGSGVGLYIVKRIMDNAGGKIEVESKLGKGTSFYLYFYS